MKFPLAIALAACSFLHASDLSKQFAVLDRDRNPSRLAAAAVDIAGSGDSKAIGQLASYLGRRSFLRRLDPGRAAQSDFTHLSRVFRALADHPSPASESLCVQLARNPEFTSVPSRLNFLLNALAAVRPLSETAAGVFRDTSRSGYLEVNGPLLARNASPRALQVLEGLFEDDSLDTAQLISVAHWALLPVRTDPAIVVMCSRLAVTGRVSPELRIAILESLFDYRPRRWFGLARNQPAPPPPWSSAPEPSRDALRSLAKAAGKRSDLPPGLRNAIQETLAQLR